MFEAQRQYPGKKIDVVNIRVSGSFSGWNILRLYLFYSIIFGSDQRINAVGDVILLDGGTPARPEREPVRISSPAVAYAPSEIDKPKGLEDAVKKVCSSIMSELQNGNKIAVMSITADNPNTSSLVLDEVEFNLVSAKRFAIVDRNTLDVIIKEQKMQISGDFDDNTLVKLGKLSGANVVIAGSVMKSGNGYRVSLKAMNVQTAQIITMARESY
jgi:TolB-like protein